MKNKVHLDVFGSSSWCWLRLYRKCTSQKNLPPNSLAVFKRNVERLLQEGPVNEELLNNAITRLALNTERTFSVYRITQRSTDRSYIGITDDFQRRMLCHQKGQGANPLHQAISCYGWEDFRYEIAVKGTMTRTMARRTDRAFIVAENTLCPAGFNQRT